MALALLLQGDGSAYSHLAASFLLLRLRIVFDLDGILNAPWAFFYLSPLAPGNWPGGRGVLEVVLAFEVEAAPTLHANGSFSLRPSAAGLAKYFWPRLSWFCGVAGCGLLLAGLNATEGGGEVRNDTDGH